MEVQIDLSELRARKNLSLREASKKIGISAMRLSQIECGEFEPATDEEMEKINAFYGKNAKYRHGGIQMTLEMTKDMMTDADYKTRFYAEYWQTKIRYDKLHRMLVKLEAGTLDFTPTCPKELLAEQASYMGNYLRVLEIRAEMEGVDLFGEEAKQ